MKALYKNPIAIAFLLLTIAGFIYFKDYFKAIDLSSLDTGSIIAVLIYLSIIMLVVEQFIEVFVDDPNQKIKKECKERIAVLEKRLEMPIDVMEGEDVIETEIMMDEKVALQEQLTTQGLKRKQRTTVIAFIIGLILSFSGMRLMSGMIVGGPEEELSEIQVTILQVIDIILTSGLIAGGSGRMHRLIKRIKEATGSSEM